MLHHIPSPPSPPFFFFFSHASAQHQRGIRNMLLKHMMLCEVVLGPHQQAGRAVAEIASKDKMKKVLIKCLAFRVQEESTVKKTSKETWMCSGERIMKEDKWASCQPLSNISLTSQGINALGPQTERKRC